MQPELKNYIKECTKEYAKWSAKIVDVRKVPNLVADEFKIETLARAKALEMATKFIKGLLPKDIQKELKPDFDTDLSNIYINKSDI
jgi:hypothetical protein